MVRTSSLPDAGNGLFADRDFKKGDYVTEYDGPRLTRIEALELKALHQHSHIRSVAAGYEYIDKPDSPLPGIGAGVWINDGTALKLNNVKFKHVGLNQLYMVATKDIRRGSEIFCNYGNTYDCL